MSELKYLSQDWAEGVARAKVNLGLWILGPREDGYHEIITFFHLISLVDYMRFKKGDELKIHMDKELPGTNLIELVLTEFSRNTGIRVSLDIWVQKNIPIGAGLGGGSTDAALALKAADALYSAGLGDELVSLGGKVGSDVAFFLLGERSAKGTSRGEVLSPIESKLEGYATLIYPGFPIESRWAYNEVRKRRAYSSQQVFQSVENVEIAIKEGDWERLSRFIRNDFEPVVFEHHPELKDIKTRLLNEGAILAFLTGSGSSIVGIFDSPNIPLFDEYEQYIVTF